MIKLFSISLSFIILFQTIGITANDFIQLDELIEHAEFHNEQYGDNLLVFISKHYGELKNDHENQNQDEKEDHEQLPFQQQTNINSTTFFTLVSLKMDLVSPFFSEFKKHNFFYNYPTSTTHLEGFFQPPRQA